MPDLRLSVKGSEYGGWKTVRVTRSIESVAGAFELSVSDRWAGRNIPWPIGEEEECAVKIDGVPVITGYVDRRSLAYSAEDHTLSVSGRDRTGALVDCSAVLNTWEFLGISLLTLAKRLAEPFGVRVSLQPGLAPPSLPTKLTVDPGESAFEALERACRLCGVLPVSDGAGGLLITRAGSKSATTALIEGQNILSASGQYDAMGRFRRYIVTGQHPGNDEYMGDATANVRGEARDPNVQRAERVLLVRSENSITPDLAKRRAQWEAKVRAARAEAVTVTVQGWTQGDGTLWPVNSRVSIRSPFIGVQGPKGELVEMLITQATHNLDEHGGTTTELWLKRPDAFLPEPVVPKAAWKEIVRGV